MPDHETPPAGEGDNVPGAAPPPADDYEYSVIDDGAPASGGMRWPLLIAAAAILPAVIVGLVVWFIASGSGGGGGTHTNEDVASILNAFSGQQGTTSTRFEGELPPGAPSGLPEYPGARLVSSLRQIQANDASYLIVYDTSDPRDKVAQYFDDQLDADPWQLAGTHADANGTVHQFSNIKDPNISGLVLVAGSKDDKVSTIVESVQVTSGATSGPKETYSPGAGRALPVGFPSDVPQYPGSVVIESSYQKQPQGNTYAIALVTKDDAAKVLDFYRGKFKDNGWTVQDTDPNAAAGAPTPPAQDASPTPAAAATAISFTDDASQLTGGVTTGALTDDDSYTRVDVQVAVPSASPTGG